MVLKYSNEAKKKKKEEIWPTWKMKITKHHGQHLDDINKNAYQEIEKKLLKP